jgi:hypothetical protein
MVLLPEKLFEPDTESVPDAEFEPPVVAALPSVEDWADPESVDLGASVIVPVADREFVADAAEESAVFEGDGVWDGASGRMGYQYHTYSNIFNGLVPAYCLMSYLASS